VFNLIDAEVFSKSDGDQLSDFGAIFDFDEAFDAPFRPEAGGTPTAMTARSL